MMPMRASRSAVAAFVGVLALGGAFIALRPEPGASAGRLPDRLGDQEFWALSGRFSEPDGVFHSDNFISNEARYQSVIPGLVSRRGTGGVYLGVGPEQNFTYIAALEPRMAFIVDIRRGNLQEHLLYKALMEMSVDRADFLSRLFSRARPEGLSAASSVEALFAAFEAEPPSPERYARTLSEVLEWLTGRHGFPLDEADEAGIDYIYSTAFFRLGPALGYSLNRPRRLGNVPTYAELMAADDGTGRQWSFLASEAAFAFLKDLQSRNLLVPVVGDFAGPQALRAIGEYVREHGATVGVFYVSNVEQYLAQGGGWDRFCANVASMPLDESSTFIRSRRAGTRAFGGPMFTSQVGRMAVETRACEDSWIEGLLGR
jgi:hypothetical protein